MACGRARPSVRPRTRTPGTTVLCPTCSTTGHYIYGPDGLPIERIGSSGSFWYFHDGLGSTAALRGSSGAIAGAYGYNAYGSVTGSTGTATSPLQFAAGYTDAETGFAYLRARYYDPVTAEFLTVDPLLDATGAAYIYVNDNPLNLADPSGDCPGLLDDARRYFYK
jgi:RHS repeat-associated protein